ncbi:MAG: hypothetical protein L3J96_03770, partial [Thermoplasmata archaeon]|nr:hypothetical protein [Thermoplasmata archaeon]
GKLLFYDTLANVTSRFAKNEAVVDVVFARPLDPSDVEKRILALPTVASCEQLDPTRLRLKLKGGVASQERLVEELVGLHLGLLSLHESASALEEIYLEQIGRGD